MNFAFRIKPKDKTVTIPQPLFESFLEAMRQWQEVSDHLEDFILARDKRFLKKMTRARAEHRAGKLKDFGVIKRQLGY